MKISITGHQGIVGSELLRRGCIPLELDIRDVNQVNEVIKEDNSDVIIHLAALTDVEQCQINPMAAFYVNTRGTFNLDRAIGTSKWMVLVSTDHVFNGKGMFPNTETRTPKPVNYYGLTKYAAESLLLPTKRLLIRTSKLFNYSSLLLIIKKLQLGKSLQFSSLIYRSYLHVNYFVDGLLYAVDNIETMPRVLHIAGLETINEYQFFERVCKTIGVDMRQITKRDWELEDVAPRPLRGGLNVNLAKSLGVPLKKISDSLELLKDEI